MTDEEKKEYEELKSLLYTGTLSQYGKRKLIDLIKKQSKEIERTNEIIIWKQRHEEQLQKEIERLKDKLNKIYNETDNKNSQLVKALNYKLFMEDKIKAKMKEKEWALENYDCDESDYKQSQAIGAWSVLQSLLEKEGE